MATLALPIATDRESPLSRDELCGIDAYWRAANYLGVTLDGERNRAARPDCELATPSSPTRVIVLQSRENLIVARAVRAVLRPPGET